MHEGLWIPTTNMWQGRNGHQAVWLILHATDCNGPCTPQAVANYFISLQGKSNPASSHYIIGTDGSLVSCVDENDTAWANGPVTQGADSWWENLDNPNFWTISIEHCKGKDNADSLTPLQQATSFALIQRICLRHGIPMRRATDSGGITGHFSMDPVNRSRCPGPYPWDALFTYLLGPTQAEWQSARDEWNHSPLSPTPPMTTGISGDWLARVLKGQRAGPPVSPEYQSVDFNGDPIVVQQFLHARCEWQAGVGRWFDARGEIR